MGAEVWDYSCDHEHSSSDLGTNYPLQGSHQQSDVNARSRAFETVSPIHCSTEEQKRGGDGCESMMLCPVEYAFVHEIRPWGASKAQTYQPAGCGVTLLTMACRAVLTGVKKSMTGADV